MFPIGDNNNDKTQTPYINYLLIGVNIFVFIFVQKWGTNEAFLMSYATVPMEIITGTDLIGNGLAPSPVPIYSTILTAMFMHGGIAHLFGNMMYLWIFGDNLESVMGHFKYLAFYLLCGFLATVAHVALANYTGAGLYIPSLGASGAISGVLGGYMILFPKNTIRMFIIPFIIKVNAFIALGLWILLQVIDGWGSLGSEGGGIAYAAHVGGFIAGLLLVKFFATPKPNVTIIR